MKESYEIKQLREKYKAAGFRVIGISQKDEGNIHVRLMDERTVECSCPTCGEPVSYFAYSRPRTYRDISPEGDDRNVILHVQRKEMHCSACGKHFTAQHKLLPNRRLTADMKNMVKFFKKNPDLTPTDIAEEFGVSASYVRGI